MSILRGNGGRASGNAFKIPFRLAVLIVFGLATSECLFGGSINPNDILVSIGNSLAGASIQYNSVEEFTPSGTLVQTIPFNYNGGSYPGTEYLRDIVVDPTGSIDAYNGTFNPYLTQYSPSTGAFTSTTLSGWSTVNNVTYGGIAAFQNYIYATDMSTAGSGSPNGIVRFDTLGGTANRYASGTDFIDLSMGLDGHLYGLYPGGSPGGTDINVYDPITMALLRTITFPTSISFSDALRSIAVDQNGNLFVVGLNGTVYRFNSNGVLEASAPTGFSDLTNIKINSAGTLIIGQDDGRVIVGNSTLTGFNSFLAINNPNASAWTTFVSFAQPVPEPCTTSLFLAALISTVPFARRFVTTPIGDRLKS